MFGWILKEKKNNMFSWLFLFCFLLIFCANVDKEMMNESRRTSWRRHVRSGSCTVLVSDLSPLTCWTLRTNSGSKTRRKANCADCGRWKCLLGICWPTDELFKTWDFILPTLIFLFLNAFMLKCRPFLKCYFLPIKAALWKLNPHKHTLFLLSETLLY